MKAHLYAVQMNARWQWYVTLDTQTDLHYWFGQLGRDSGILMLDPPLSLGQARHLCDQLTSTSVHNAPPPLFLGPPHLSSVKAATQAVLSEITQRIIAIAAQCNMQGPFREAIRLTPISYEKWREGVYADLHMEQSFYDQIVQAVNGRSLLVEEMIQLLEHLGFDPETFPWLSYIQLAYLNGDLTITNGLKAEVYREPVTFWKKSTSYSCKRCGSGKERMFESPCVFCGDACSYCEECLTMGRTRFCSLLILGNTPSIDRKLIVSQSVAHQQAIAPWDLSQAQAAASLEGLKFIDQKGRVSATNSGESSRAYHAAKFLIWAVTGAGKTEMIFPFIRHVTDGGGKVLIATPRKDVVLELQPRITKAFTDRSVVTLYGGSEQRWEHGDITIATTHQLLRFHQAFDLVIIDEIDAFPYHNNPVLEYAAHKVCHPGGTYILLSATPPSRIRKQAERGRLPHVKVPVRFHRHPLPVPELIATPSLRQIVKTGKLPARLKVRLQASVERGAQLFVFVPHINLVEPTVLLLRKEMSIQTNDRHGDGSALAAFGPIEGTSSKDPFRSEKVRHFRDRDIRLLVTTTILERGVTVPRSDVFILDSDTQLFDEAALVQMSGRAGRSREDPAGKVYFAAKEKTKSQSEAVKQIKNMNRLASKQGYFKGDNY